MVAGLLYYRSLNTKANSGAGGNDMIVKRNNNYYVVIKYKSVSGTIKKKWVAAGTNRRNAQKLERELLLRRDNGEIFYDRSDAPTVSSYVSEWLETTIKPPAKSLGTYENYLFCIKKITPLIGSTKLNKLTAIQVTKAYRKLQADGLSITSVRMIHRVLRAAFNKAVKWDLINKNPCLNADVPAPTPSPAIALTKDEAMALLMQSEKNSPYDNAIIALGMLCGLRDAESCGLRWQDYQDTDGKLTIEHNLSERYADTIDSSLYDYFYRPAKGKKALVLDKTKTESSHDFIMLPHYVQERFHTLRLLYHRKRLQVGPAFHDDGFILCDDTGIPYSPHKIYYVVQRIWKQYNKEHPATPLPKIRAHDLRHTAATLLLEENVDIKYVSRQLRHSSTTITQNLYQHVSEKTAWRTANAMDEIFHKKEG